MLLHNGHNTNLLYFRPEYVRRCSCQKRVIIRSAWRPHARVKKGLDGPTEGLAKKSLSMDLNRGVESNQTQRSALC